MQDAIKMMEAKMSPDAVLSSRIIAEKEIFALRQNNHKKEFVKNQDDFDNSNKKQH